MARDAKKDGEDAPLSTYRAMRDAKRTPEPMGATAKRGRRSSKAEPIFVIQEHHARALHWDFRLERDGVLASWALPKGLPVDPKQNNLAVHVEDHPFDYKDFEGEIPKGEYGAGTVRIWDHGTYETEKWRDDEVIVVLHGDRADGRFVLFRTKAGDDKNWMIHRMGEAPADFEPMPSTLSPMLATAGGLPRERKEWALEFKWDGVRALVFVEGGRVRALSRNGGDLLTAFPELRQLGSFLGSTTAILDGELVCFDEEGRPSFGLLQRRLHVASPPVAQRRAREHPASFLAFDVLYLLGHSTTHLDYDERRALLESLELKGDTFATPPAYTDVGAEDLQRVSVERGLEGLVAKRRSSTYLPGQRTSQWIKVKNVRTQEVVLGGWTEGKGSRASSLGALLLGVPGDGGLTYVGKVGTGFTDVALEDLLAELRPLVADASPFTGKLPAADARGARYVRPELVGEVQFSEWTGDGHLRHPTWRGLRPDKRPGEVAREP
jgi:bifunctional non-homologous end joining protein LigD